MPDSPLPPHSRRRSDDHRETDFTLIRRGPNSGDYFEGETRSELRHLAEAIERLDVRLEAMTREITDLRLFRAKLLGQAGVVAGLMSAAVSIALTLLGWLIKR